MAFLYPWGNTQQLNLDWILKKIKELETGVGAGAAEVTAIANALLAATYSAGSAYDVGDIVYRNQKLYVCNTAITSPGETWDPSHWDEVLLGDAVADLIQKTAGGIVQDVRYNNHKIQQKKAGSYADVITIEDTPSNNSDRLASSKAVYNLQDAINKVDYKQLKDWNLHTNLSDVKYYDGTVNNADLYYPNNNLKYGIITAIEGRLYYRNLNSSLLFKKLVWLFNTRANTRDFAFGTYVKDEATTARFGTKFKVTGTTGNLQISRSDWLNDSNDNVARNLNIGFTISTYEVIQITLETIGSGKLILTIESVTNPTKTFTYVHDAMTGGNQLSNKITVLGGICFKTLSTSGECWIYQMSQIANNDNQADILIIGDSFVTANQNNLNTDDGFAYKIRDAVGEKCVAGGIPGITSTGLLSRVQNNDYNVAHYKYGFVQIGSNDSISSMTSDTFISNLQSIIQYLKNNGCTPILTTIPIRTDTDNNNTFTSTVNAWIKTSGELYIDENALLTSSYILSDGVHPNSNGHEIIYKTLSGLIGKLSAVEEPYVPTAYETLVTGLQLVSRTSIPSNGSVSVSGQSHEIYLVVGGTWNRTEVFIVMPTQGNTPKTFLLANYDGNTTLQWYSVSANGNWGITLTNNTTSDMNTLIFKFMKHI